MSGVSPGSSPPRPIRPDATLHRLVAPVPLILLLAASIADASALTHLIPSALGAPLASILLVSGVGSGFGVLLTGVREVLVRRIPPEAFAWLSVHAGTLHLGLRCGLVSWRARQPDRAPTYEAAIEWAGIALLAVAACAGRTLARRCGMRR